MSLSHDSSNPNKSYTIFFGIWVWSRASTRNSNSISTRRPDQRDDKWGEVSLRLQELEALDDKRMQAQQ